MRMACLLLSNPPSITSSDRISTLSSKNQHIRWLQADRFLLSRAAVCRKGANPFRHFCAMLRHLSSSSAASDDSWSGVPAAPSLDLCIRQMFK